MFAFRKSVLFASASVVAACALPAFAQEAPTEIAAAEAPSFYSDADIVVTARRRDELLQEVPISITVFNQRQLADRNVNSAVDLAAYTPSLTANARFGTENASFTLRGFTQELRTTASVAVYFADVVAPRAGSSVSAGDGSGPGNFFDLQNVQVLKGPQGTLFGRNTTGGAILLVPTKPGADFGGYVEGSYGNYDMKRVQGVVNVPLSETFRARAGFDWQERDGLTRNISGIGPDRFSDLGYITARLSVVGDLTPNLENYTIFSYTRSSNNGTIPKMIDCNPALFPLGTLTCGQLDRADAADAGFHHVDNQLANSYNIMEMFQIINTTTWQANDNLTIKNIISYSQLKNNSATEVFGTNWIIPQTNFGPIPNTGALGGSHLTFNSANSFPGGATNNQATFTEELQFQGRSSDDRLTWQAGLYYESSTPLGFYGHQNPANLSCTDVIRMQCTDVLAPLIGQSIGTVSYMVGHTEFRNFGIYGQATYNLTDKFSVTGGLRYTDDMARSTGHKAVYRFPQPNTPVGFCTNPLVRPANQPISAPSDCAENFRKATSAPTWMLSLDYTPSSKVLVYGKYSRGYRQGSVNAFGADGFNTFDAETVDTFEVGTKLTFAEQIRGILNIAAFYNDFKDQQLQIGFANSQNLIAPNAGIVNAGRSRIWGVEVETSISPFQGLVLSGSYAYLNTEIIELTPPSLREGSLYDVFINANQEGDPLPFTPKNKLSVSATYTLPVSEDVGRISIGGTFSYSDGYVVSPTPYGTLPSYHTVNLNLNWQSIGGGPVDASFFITNLTNEEYYVNVTDQMSRVGLLAANMGDPRLMGARVRLNF